MSNTWSNLRRLPSTTHSTAVLDESYFTQLLTVLLSPEATTMRFYLIATLTYLTSFVYAGGFHGCLERVWLYQAYLIDELNDEADRTIGFRCKKWDDKSKPQLCTNDEWEACKPQRGSGRCNFDQLMVHLGRAPQLKDWDRRDGNGKLNVEETAKRCNELFSNKNQPVKNFPGFKAIKGGTEEFNDYIKKLAKKTNDTYKNKVSEIPCLTGVCDVRRWPQ